MNMQQQEFSCICGKFQKDGIVCCHVLRVLSHLNMSVLPEKYYIDRWRPKNTKDIRDIRFNVPLELTAGSQHLRYTLLSNRLNEMASDGASTNRKYLYVVAECERVQQKLDEMTKEDELAQAQQANVDKDTIESDAAPHPNGYADKLEDPDVAVSKGRPQKGRYETFMESLPSKQKVTCSRCGKPDHYKSSCSASTEDVNLAQREKVSRKQTSGFASKTFLFLVLPGFYCITKKMFMAYKILQPHLEHLPAATIWWKPEEEGKKRKIKIWVLEVQEGKKYASDD